MTTEQVDTSLYYDDEETAPLTAEQFDQMGGFSPLDPDKERLEFDAIVTSPETNKKGHEELSVRIGFKVGTPGINNPEGRPASIFFRLPEKSARASAKNLQQQFNIAVDNMKSIFLALLGGTGAEEPGDYPVTDGPDGVALLHPLEFVSNPTYQELLAGRTLIADVVLNPAGETVTNKKGESFTRKKASNSFSNFRIDADE